MKMGKRIQYIIDYYWLWILGIGCAAALAAWCIYRLAFVPGDYWICGIFANTQADIGTNSQFWELYRDYTGYDTSEKNIEFNAASWFDPSKKGGINNSYFESFAAVAEAGDLDFIVMEKEGLEALGATGRLLDLSLGEELETGADVSGENASNINTAFLSILDELREDYSDRFVYTMPADTSYSEVPVPIGIDISDSILMDVYEIYPDSCVLGISAYSKRPEAVQKFLEFILEGTEDDADA